MMIKQTSIALQKHPNITTQEYSEMLWSCHGQPSASSTYLCWIWLLLHLLLLLLLLKGRWWLLWLRHPAAAAAAGRLPLPLKFQDLHSSSRHQIQWNMHCCHQLE